MQLAEFKVGRHLAEATTNQAPDEIETFDLFAADPALPKVVYIAAASLTWHNPHSGLAYYGLPIRESLPTFMHPNEFLDRDYQGHAHRQRQPADHLGL